MAGEDEVQLDEEMDRVVWSEGMPRPPAAAGAPRRDHAAPQPLGRMYAIRTPVLHRLLFNLFQ